MAEHSASDAEAVKPVRRASRSAVVVVLALLNSEADAQPAAAYAVALRPIGIEPPQQVGYGTHVWHLYIIQVAKRAKVQEQLSAAGISTGIHYPIPVHLQKAYADLGYQRGAFPVAEAAADRILSLPMFPELTQEQVRYVVENLKRCL